MQQAAALDAAVASDRVPSGAWAVGVSGGADSVALLHLLATRRDLRLVVTHLNHELRGDESDEDERFVARLAQSLKLPLESARPGDLNSNFLPSLKLPINPSARFRRLRFIHFANTIQSHRLDGVILAHHADDQAETVFHRLVRGSGYAGLIGMSRDSHVGRVRVLRPLLSVRAAPLREHLASRGIAWREDSSNRSEKYVRNRIRAILRQRDELHQPLIDLADRSRALREWVRNASPALEEEFAARTAADLPQILAREALARWLRRTGTPVDEVTPAVVQRLLTMCVDASSPPRAQFPGGLTVRRRAGRITAQS